ncbi:MAG: PQQ-dependent sugar dehydrogenase [Actinomycetota bacterium]
MRRDRSIVRLLLVLALVCTTFAALGGTNANAGTGIIAKRVVGDLRGPAAFTFLKDGRIVYLERGTGQIHIYNPKTKANSRFFTVPGVNGEGERGALGVAVSPGWPKPRALYVYATRSTGSGLQNQILKVARSNGHAHMRVLVSQPASSAAYHNGGRILFGPDGMLYAIIGDGHDSSNSQDLGDNLRGKILRMTPAGGVPSNNPIAGSRIFAFGIRNSYGFTFDPQTDRLWETENGPECNDEINLIVSGGNFGWGPSESCGGDPPGNTNNNGPAPRRLPKLWFVGTIGITGDAFCDGCSLGAQVEGQLFFGDVNTGVLRRVALNAARDDVSGGAIDVLDSPGGIYSMETAPNGAIYFSDAQAIYRLSPA